MIWIFDNLVAGFLPVEGMRFSLSVKDESYLGFMCIWMG